MGKENEKPQKPGKPKPVEKPKPPQVQYVTEGEDTDKVEKRKKD
jgi:hypothetical protein